MGYLPLASINIVKPRKRVVVVPPAFNPDTYTSLDVNIPFDAAHLTALAGGEPPTGDNQAIATALNLGTADLILNNYYGSTEYKYRVNCAGTGRPGIDQNLTAGNALLNTLGSDEVTSRKISAYLSAAEGWVTVVAKILNTSPANGRLISTIGAYLYMQSDGNNGLVAANYDTNYDTTESQVAGEGAVHVYTWKHVGGNLYLGIDGVYGNPVASGNTGSTNVEGYFMHLITGSLLRVMAHKTVPADEATIIAGLKTYYGIA